MLRKISIQNFKAIERIDDLDLGRITLVGGKNNSGKSTLLEAIYLYFNFHKEDSDPFATLQLIRLMPSTLMRSESRWGPFFHKFDMSKEIKIKTIESEVSEEGILEVRFDEKFKSEHPVLLEIKEPKNINFEEWEFLKENETALIINQNENETKIVNLGNGGFYRDGRLIDLKKTKLMFLMTTFDFSRYSDLAAERLAILDAEDRQGELVEALKLLEPEFRELRNLKIEGKNIIHAKIGDRKPKPIHYLGDGFCRALSIVLVLATTRDGIILIDEIENGLHHSILRDFWQAIIEAAKLYNCQIIATTHSFEMIEALSESAKEIDFKDIAYIRMDKEGDKVSAAQYKADVIANALRFDMEVR
ncbi:MAG: AAA family ATPase [Myxococcales bacterium]|jgi:AAA15 family ATPase/GTPase|nr:AAA family ATPase [Myxococcales bacterium]